MNQPEIRQVVTGGGVVEVEQRTADGPGQEKTPVGSPSLLSAISIIENNEANWSPSFSDLQDLELDPFDAVVEPDVQGADGGQVTNVVADRSTLTTPPRVRSPSVEKTARPATFTTVTQITQSQVVQGPNTSTPNLERLLRFDYNRVPASSGALMNPSSNVMFSSASAPVSAVAAQAQTLLSQQPNQHHSYVQRHLATQLATTNNIGSSNNYAGDSTAGAAGRPSWMSVGNATWTPSFQTNQAADSNQVPPSSSQGQPSTLTPEEIIRRNHNSRIASIVHKTQMANQNAQNQAQMGQRLIQSNDLSNQRAQRLAMNSNQAHLVGHIRVNQADSRKTYSAHHPVAAIPRPPPRQVQLIQQATNGANLIISNRSISNSLNGNPMVGRVQALQPCSNVTVGGQLIQTLQRPNQLQQLTLVAPPGHQVGQPVVLQPQNYTSGQIQVLVNSRTGKATPVLIPNNASAIAQAALQAGVARVQVLSHGQFAPLLETLRQSEETRQTVVFQQQQIIRTSSSTGQPSSGQSSSAITGSNFVQRQGRLSRDEQITGDRSTTPTLVVDVSVDEAQNDGAIDQRAASMAEPEVVSGRFANQEEVLQTQLYGRPDGSPVKKKKKKLHHMNADVEIEPANTAMDPIWATLLKSGANLLKEELEKETTFMEQLGEACQTRTMKIVFETAKKDLDSFKAMTETLVSWPETFEKIRSAVNALAEDAKIVRPAAEQDDVLGAPTSPVVEQMETESISTLSAYSPAKEPVIEEEDTVPEDLPVQVLDPNWISYYTQMAEDSSKMYKCNFPDCSLSFFKSSSVVGHLAKDHKIKGRLLKAPAANGRDLTPTNTASRAALGLRTSIVKCPYPHCDKTFTRDSFLFNNHKKEHELSSSKISSTTSKCSHCPKHFATTEGLSFHEKICRTLVACGYKGCQVRTKPESIQAHIAAHLASSPIRRAYVCEWRTEGKICGRAFKNDTELESHRLNHQMYEQKEKSRKKESDVAKVVSWSANVSATHSAVTPFSTLNHHKCKTCPRIFTTKSTLSHHVQICHSDGNASDHTHKCHYCSRMFKSPSKLAHHAVVAHKNLLQAKSVSSNKSKVESIGQLLLKGDMDEIKKERSSPVTSAAKVNCSKSEPSSSGYSFMTCVICRTARMVDKETHHWGRVSCNTCYTYARKWFKSPRKIYCSKELNCLNDDMETSLDDPRCGACIMTRAAAMYELPLEVLAIKERAWDEFKPCPASSKDVVTPEQSKNKSGDEWQRARVMSKEQEAQLRQMVVVNIEELNGANLWLERARALIARRQELDKDKKANE